MIQELLIPEPEKPKTQSAEFVLRFQKFYEAVVKQPYDYKREHFIITARLIKKHGFDCLVAKAAVLAKMCSNRSSWFTKNGWADFSIEKLSNRWNEILIEAVQPTPEEEYAAVKLKWRQHDERVNAKLDKRGRVGRGAGA